MKFLHRILGIGMVALAWCVSVVSLSAHDPGLSTLIVQVQPEKVEATLVLAVKDAPHLAGGTVSAAKLEAYPPAACEMAPGGEPVRAERIRGRIDDNGNATIEFQFTTSRHSKLKLRSVWLAQLPHGHRQFVRIEDAQGQVLATKLLSAGSDSIPVELADFRTSPAATKTPFVDFLRLGVKHILTGYDHLLFLLSLLLVTKRLVSALKIITAFTAAHSITLALAALEVVRVPASVVEPIIAASIIYVAVENLVRGEMPRGRALLTFTFGLVHGLGFASALREAGLGSSGEVVVPLVAFNVGVELGQLIVAATVLPLLMKMGQSPHLSGRLAPACSVVIAVAGGFWLVQRLWFA